MKYKIVTVYFLLLFLNTHTHTLTENKIATPMDANFDLGTVCACEWVVHIHIKF